eukprot:scaffold3873_cov177-Ochromonas_danica.AAC.14
MDNVDIIYSRLAWEMAESDDKIAKLENRIGNYENKNKLDIFDGAETENESNSLMGLINSNRRTFNRLLDQKKPQTFATNVKTLTLLVKLCIEDKVYECLITFTTLKRPLDTVKEEVSMQGLRKHGMSFDSYRLVTTGNAVVSDFASIQGQPSLIFHNPEKIIPLSGNEWNDVQLEELKIVFEDVDLVDFFSNADLPGGYIPVGDGGDQIDGARAFREDPLLQHPICKALFTAREKWKQEPFIDDFVTHLLNEMGFNEGSLYAAPQMQFNLFYGDIKKMVTADVTIIDLLSSYASIGVFEEKNWEDLKPEGDSTARLVAEGIAIIQHNEAVRRRKRDVGGNLKAGTDLSIPSTASSETVYGIRVLGSLFYFYALRVSSEIHSAMKNQTAADSSTVMYRYKSYAGLDFMVKKERDEITHMLSLLQEVAKRTGESN